MYKGRTPRAEVDYGNSILHTSEEGEEIFKNEDSSLRGEGTIRLPW